MPPPTTLSVVGGRNESEHRLPASSSAAFDLSRRTLNSCCFCSSATVKTNRSLLYLRLRDLSMAMVSASAIVCHRRHIRRVRGFVGGLHLDPNSHQQEL